MRIQPELIAEIAEKVKEIGLDSGIVTTLRQQYPDIHFTYCMDDDINNMRPVLETAFCNFYLIDSREHCLALTKDFAIAKGIVLAEVIAEEE